MSTSQTHVQKQAIEDKLSPFDHRNVERAHHAQLRHGRITASTPGIQYHSDGKVKMDLKTALGKMLHLFNNPVQKQTMCLLWTDLASLARLLLCIVLCSHYGCSPVTNDL